MPVSNELTRNSFLNAAFTAVSSECVSASISYTASMPISNERTRASFLNAAATPVSNELPEATDTTPVSSEFTKTFNSVADATPVSSESNKISSTSADAHQRPFTSACVGFQGPKYHSAINGRNSPLIPDS